MIFDDLGPVEGFVTKIHTTPDWIILSYFLIEGDRVIALLAQFASCHPARADKLGKPAQGPR